MKKKLNISVIDIVHKANIPKNKQQIAHHRQISTPVIVDKPLRFQDLYKKATEENRKHNESGGIKVIYDSKKTTPIQTNRIKRASVNSIVRNTKSVLSSALPSQKKSTQCITPKASNIKQSLKNSKQKQVHRSKSQSKLKAHKQNNQSSFKKKQVKKNHLDIEQCFSFLNHQDHSHLRQRNQCFLTERQIDFILAKLGFQFKHPKYSDFMALLQVDIYGGAPSQNLKQILKLVEASCHYKQNKQSLYTRQRLPKIIDNNLQLHLTKQNQQYIKNYFTDFFKPQIFASAQKQNKGFLANCQSLNKIQSFENILKERKSSHNLQISDQIMYSSPDKKLSNSVISGLIEALTQSQKKKQQVVQNQDITNLKQFSNKMKADEEQNMNTFRRIQSSGFDQTDENQYNFSRQLSGDKGLQMKQDTNIVQLKNRLNEALKKTQTQTNQFFIDDQQNINLIALNATKINRKPILSVDVNLGEGVSQKITVFQGQTAKQVSERLALKFTINQQTKTKFQKMLESHLNTMLWKIDELSEEMLTDRDQDFID